MSGGSTAVGNLSRGLQGRGLSVRHVSLRPGTAEPVFPTWVLFPWKFLDDRPLLRGAGVRGLLRAPLWPMKRVLRRVRQRRLRRLVEGMGADDVVVCSHVIARQALAETGYTAKHNGPLLIGQHHSSFASLHHEPWLAGLIRPAFAADDCFVCLTDEDATRFREVMDVPVRAIPNALFSEMPRSNLESRTVVALSRFSAEKQLDVLIAAFADATRDPELRGWRLHLYGDGPEADFLRSTIADLGAEDRIELLPPTADSAAVLAGAALHAMSSLYEGFPMSLLEASSAGVASIVFDCSAGVRDLVPSDAGVLVPAGDVPAFTQALRDAMGDRDHRVRMGQAARRHADSYRHTAITPRWLALFDELGERRRESNESGQS
ncbi:glycosyltransferase [Aestuariimicrobium ganziense]|uniref:glycosyltransferase n=1 Tax=Aestuariimicrobium ganziense TaxID=2773677 RepID=UPI001F43BFC3|nr:glycosyltransferase [Aestuariimicrobium ganziense]